MFRLNRLFSSTAAAGAGAGAPFLIGLHRLGNFALSHSSSAAIDDFVYLGKDYKICRKNEIEGPISNTFKWNSFQKRNSYKRKVLPPKLMSRTVVRLTCESAAEGGICNVYLVGTKHDCEKTWQEAKNVIKFLQPQVVYLELCSDRLVFLTRQSPKVPTMGEMFDEWKKNEDPLGILFKWFDAKMASHIDEIDSGGDIRVAYKEAMVYGAKVILGDRPNEITRRRIMSKMSVWRYLFHPEGVPIAKDLFKTAKDELDLITLISQEMAKKYPSFFGPLVHERDQYMSAKLLQVARQHSSVVAVVGVGHLAGIQKNWKQPIDIKQLLDTGTNTFTMGKILSSIGAMVFFLSLSDSQIHRIRCLLSFIHSLRIF